MKTMHVYIFLYKFKISVFHGRIFPKVMCSFCYPRTFPCLEVDLDLFVSRCFKNSYDKEQ